MKKLVSDQIVDYLERRGVEYVFGLCGHTVIAMLDAFARAKKLRYISVRHEQIAATAADGYARVAHKAGVMICHLGPGLTNATTGVANAAFDSIPMVVIAGDVPSYYYGRWLVGNAYHCFPKERRGEVFRLLYDYPHTNDTFIAAVKQASGKDFEPFATERRGM